MSIYEYILSCSSLPLISINSPSHNSYLFSSEIEVQGQITDPHLVSSATLKLNANSPINLTLDERGYFTQTVTLVDGQNTILVAGTDGIDNSSNVSIEITFGPPPIIINEISTGNPDYIEIHNPENQLVQIGGMKLYWFDLDNLLEYTFIIPENISIAPGAYLVINEGGSTDNNTETSIYMETHIQGWAENQDGAIALLDKNNLGVDFVRWGDSEVSSPSGTAWSGTNPPAPPYPGVSLGRNPDGYDSNSGSDWCIQEISAGYTNNSCSPTCYHLERKYEGEGEKPGATPNHSPGCPLNYYIQGQTILMTPHPGDGYTIDHWSGTLAPLSTEFTMPTQNHIVTAYYAQNSPAATFPFFDGFESGSLDSWWSTSTTSEGRVRVTSSYPHEGNYSVLLDDSIPDGEFSYASLILTVDLEGEPDVFLDFWWREFNDEPHVSDGVFISDDEGSTWHKIYSFDTTSQSYQRTTIDLGTTTQANGLSFNNNFLIKFQFYDNYSVPTDGFSIDDVTLRKPFATIPFHDGFESGSFNQWWSTSTTNLGRVQIGSSYSYDGIYSVLLDSPSPDYSYSYASLILTIDLAGESDIFLDFWWREFNDEYHFSDGVFISDDGGTNWYKIYSFNTTSQSYHFTSLNLNDAASEHNIAFNNQFLIKFQFYDNYAIPTDGFSIDNIDIEKKFQSFIPFIVKIQD